MKIRVSDMLRDDDGIPYVVVDGVPVQLLGLPALTGGAFHLPGRHDQSTHGHGRQYATPRESKAFLDDHYTEWRNELSNDEYNALAFYQSPGFALVNDQLRGRKPSGSPADLRRARKAAVDLKRAIAKAPPLTDAVIVHRGFSADQFDDLRVMSIIRDRGFVSTSFTPDVVSVGRATSPATMEIKLPRGTRAAAGSVRELVLPPGAAFRVMKVTRLRGQPHFVVDYLPEGT